MQLAVHLQPAWSESKRERKSVEWLLPLMPVEPHSRERDRSGLLQQLNKQKERKSWDRHKTLKVIEQQPTHLPDRLFCCESSTFSRNLFTCKITHRAQLLCPHSCAVLNVTVMKPGAKWIHYGTPPLHALDLKISHYCRNRLFRVVNINIVISLPSRHSSVDSGFCMFCTKPETDLSNSQALFKKEIGSTSAPLSQNVRCNLIHAASSSD